MRSGALVLLVAVLGVLAVATTHAQSSRTVKPLLHRRYWVAITGKPLAYDPRAKKDRDFCYGDPAFPPEEPVAGHHGEDDYGIAW
jgi:hypothetical protein